MGATHCPIDCIRALQESHPDDLADLGNISKITMEMAEAALAHGGWDVKRPVQVLGAQMSDKFVVACQLVDKSVLPPQFSQQKLDRDIIWELVDKASCVHNSQFDKDKAAYRTCVTIEFQDGRAPITVTKEAARGVEPLLSNEEIVAKWRHMTEGLIDAERRLRIEEMVLGLEKVHDMQALAKELAGWTRNAMEQNQ